MKQSRLVVITFAMLVAGTTMLNIHGCREFLGIGILAADMCVTDERCNDGLFCNGEERCVDGGCQDGVEPCNAIACDEDTNTCSGDGCTVGSCDDGLFCNGEELCTSEGMCINGDLPCFPGEFCVETDGRCVECTADDQCGAGRVCIDELCIEAPTEPERFTVFLRNEDIDQVHLLTASESFGPSNRVNANGGQRIVELGPALAGDVFTFRAGRNGSAFATIDCEFFPDSTEDAVVTWTGFELTCSGELTLD